MRRSEEKGPGTQVPGPTSHWVVSYSMMLEMRPSPTVWPPSRIANLSPSSMAMPWMSSQVTVTWSPGMAISTLVPLESVRAEMSPVMSVVRK